MESRFRYRRLLLKSAATLGVWSQVRAARSDSPSEKLSIGVIGVGGRGSDNLAALAGENIAALCDVDERAIGAAGARYPQARTYRDFRKLVTHRGLDAVVVATPNHTHANAVIAALRSGLHVYCEKPLAHNLHETRRMVEVARENKRITQMGNQHHASPGYRRAVQLLASGVLGPVREVHAWTSRPLWPQGMARPTAKIETPPALDWDLWLGPAPARPYNAAYLPRLWRGWWDFGGGAMGDFVPHILDPVYEGLALGAPTKISPESPASNDESFPEWSVVRFEFPQRKELSPVVLWWWDGGKQPPRDVTGVERLANSGALVLGEHGKLFIPELGKRPIVVANDPREALALPDELVYEGTHWDHWVQACKSNKVDNGFEYGAGLTNIALLGNIAVRLGRSVKWDDAKYSFGGDAAANELVSRHCRRGWELD